MSLGCFPHFFQQKVQVLNKNKTKKQLQENKKTSLPCVERHVCTNMCTGKEDIRICIITKAERQPQREAKCQPCPKATI